MLNQLGCDFHHLGVACRDLEQEIRLWSQLGYQQESPIFEDPVQSVRGLFLTGPGPRLELLVSLTQEGPVAQMVRRGIKIYHQGFEAPDFDDAIALLRAANYKLVKGPVPAVAFAGRRIAFFLMPNMNLIEIIESERQAT
jgi:methylmalonyl-CoA/ethylmalonyl-CoA epimerase